MTEEKNWHSPRPEALPETWETQDLNFIPFLEVNKTGWRTHTGFGADYEIQKPESDNGKFTMTTGIKSAVMMSREFQCYEDAAAAAQADFLRHMLSGLRIR